MKTKTISIQRLTGQEILPFISALAELRIRIFREYPYLYDGDMAYEADYLKHYATSSHSLIILARENERVIGASTAMPLQDYGQEVSQPFQMNGYEPRQVFYFGESVLEHHYRGRGIGVRFFEEREAFARECGYAIAAFCAVERPDNHPRKPADYQSLDAFWNKRGYQKHPTLITHFCWKDLDEAEESPKPLSFWLKTLE